LNKVSLHYAHAPAHAPSFAWKCVFKLSPVFFISSPNRVIGRGGIGIRDLQDQHDTVISLAFVQVREENRCMIIMKMRIAAHLGIDLSEEKKNEVGLIFSQIYRIPFSPFLFSHLVAVVDCHYSSHKHRPQARRKRLRKRLTEFAPSLAKLPT
jgi:hypothetical protein